MKRFSFWISLALMFLLASGVALARKIYLNGVRIDGVTNQTFRNVKVKIDGNGDIHITGKHYRVKKKGADTTPTRTTPPSRSRYNAPSLPRDRTPGRRSQASRRNTKLLSYPSQSYVMVIQRSGAKASGYALKIYINGSEVRSFPIDSMQDVMDLTPHLKKGTNKVMIEASKEVNNASGTVTLRISRGKIKGGKVMIQQPFKLEYSRKSSESNNYRHIYTIVTK